MKDFHKSESCPASKALLALASAELCDERAAEIGEHLADCDFCSMEVEMYSRFPQAEEQTETPLIPRPLFELAKMLLPRRRDDGSTVDSVFGDDGEFELGQPCGAF